MPFDTTMKNQRINWISEKDVDCSNILHLRCGPAATAARLTCLARLGAPPFSLHARKILGLSAETRQRLGANNIGDAGLAALASACGSGALPALTFLGLG